MTTLPSKTLTFAVLPPPKRLHDNSFSRVFADSSTLNHTSFERPRSCKDSKKIRPPDFFSDSSTQNASFTCQNPRMGRQARKDFAGFHPPGSLLAPGPAPDSPWEALGELWETSGELLGGLGRSETSLRGQNISKTPDQPPSGRYVYVITN